MALSILVLGGTRFVGRHIVQAAVDRGHQVTLFNRGTQPEVFPALEQIHGDRDRAFADGRNLLAGRTFDVVLDVNAYVPRWVRQAVEALRGAVDRYAFISTVSVYGLDPASGVDEDGPVVELDDPTTEVVDADTYGGLKVLCEREVTRAFPDALLIRPGVVVGPHDPTDRFTYWARRIARGGEVLAPGRPSDLTQYIDARDLAAFVLDGLERGWAGPFNAVCPPHPIGDLLQTCQEVSGSGARLTWVPEEVLAEQQVAPFTELPLWLPQDRQGMVQVRPDRAVAAGLRFRPLSETVQDTLAWDGTLPADRPLRAGLTPEREAEALEAVRA